MNDNKSCNVKWKLHGNISRNSYGNAVVGRYGGCFEKDIMRLMCERANHLAGFGCTGEVCTILNVRKGNAQHRRG